jgi:hypothetical protein
LRRLTDSVIVNERYRGEPSTDESGRTVWPTCVVWDDEVQGLGVRILPPMRGKPSRKDFIVTWKVGIKSRTMAIGTYGIDCTLRQARRIARQAIDLARRGRDPIQERQLALGIGTTEDLASRFLFEHNAAKKKPAATVAPELESPEPSEQQSGEGPTAEPPVPADDAVAADGAQSQVEPIEGGQLPAVAAAPMEPTSPVATGETFGSPRSGAAPAPDPVGVPARVEAPVEPAVEAAPPVDDARLDQLAPAEPGAAAAESQAGAAAPAATAPEPLTTPGSPPPPAGAAPPQLASDAARRAHDAQAAAARSPARMRMVALPAGLHRDIERRARALGLTQTAYLQALVDLETAAAEKSNGGSVAAPLTRAEEIFAKVQGRQSADAPAGVPDTTTTGE